MINNINGITQSYQSDLDYFMEKLYKGSGLPRSYLFGKQHIRKRKIKRIFNL
jgi:hypothetical protein